MPHQHPHPRAAPLASRGVYEHPFVGPQGERYLVAVDRRGRRVLEAAIYPGTSDPAAVTAILRDMLDQMDPPARLRLVP